MRPILFLLISIIFTACGHNKLRFSRVQKKQKVVEISEVPNLKKTSKSTIAYNSQTEELKPQRSESITSTSIEEDESAQELTVQPIEEISLDFPKTVEDSTRISQEEADAITADALQAEKDGTRSLTFGILFYAMGVAAFILLFIGLVTAMSGGEPFFIIGSLVIGVVALVSLILGMVFGIKSLRSPFNTLRGRRRAIAGVILSGIGLTVVLANFLLSFF